MCIRDNIGGQRLVTGAEEVLRPGTDVGMLDGSALLVAGADDVLPGGMHPRFGSHAADDAELVRLFGEVLHRSSQLKVSLGFDRRFRSLRRAILRVQRVDVGHATDHLEKDDVLGLAKAGTRRPGSLGGFGCKGAAAETVQHGDAESGAGPALAKGTTGNGIKLVVKIHGSEE